MGRRVLAIWFPALPVERWLRLRPQAGPFALILRAGNADHLHCVSREALARGLWRGMPLADARALCPDLATHPADLPADRAFLGALGRWAGRYSPWVAAEGADGLVADVTGAAHLFGGEAGMLDDLAARLGRAGITARAAIADTRGAALALARHGAGGTAPEGETLAAIGALPVAALRIDTVTAAALARLGLKTIRDLTLTPRAPLARRFGQGLMLRLDQALGAVGEPVSPDPEPPNFAVRLTLPEPIGLVSDVEAGLARLLARLCATLERHGRGARWLRLELRRVDGGSVAVETGLARPMREPARIAALFRDGIGRVEAGFGIDRMRLIATVTEAMQPAQLGAVREAGEDRLADLVTRLGNRLGFDHVLRFLPAESHVPERSFMLAPVAYSAAAGAWPQTPERPLAIFAPEPLAASGADLPTRFRWRRMALAVRQATGPERIAPEWWFDDPAWRTGLRDYWRVETDEGLRLWLFHTPQSPGWYVQGQFA
jgi:protein ImuB